MRILFLAAEAVPYVKIGGLGDVAGAMPAALRRLGADVRLMLPRYGTVDPLAWDLRPVLPSFNVTMDWRNEDCALRATPDGATFFVENQHFFGARTRIYGSSDEPEQFVLFCRAALESCLRTGWIPDVINAHDWHAAAAIRLHRYAPDRAGLVFTIHNIAHQGRCMPSKWPLLGVYDGRGEMNLMEQAIWAADMVTTVSPTYAQEILRPEYGFGLEAMLRERQDRLAGILNGLDLEAWDPATDPALAAPFHAGDLSGKAACKADLQKRVGLPVLPEVPLIGVVARLDFQKGMDLLVQGLHDLVAFSNAQIVILGSGDSAMEASLARAAAMHPHRIATILAFDVALSRRIYAGSDMFLMPSLFEPCGLSQMLAMRYGSLPVARATGGLVDTVLDRSRPDGFGYLFGPFDRGAMLGALGRALADFAERGPWEAAMRRAMLRDFSWDRSAKEYLEVYERARALATAAGSAR